MAIYTKTGDNGSTSLANGERVPKTNARIEAYGTVDELNCQIGLLRAMTRNMEETAAQLQSVQNRLFNLGAELSGAPGEWITERDVNNLEEWIDRMQALLPKQQAFILPYGDEATGECHVCRAVCRRAERRMLETEASKRSLCFINRLSDYLFVLARYITFCKGGTEEPWKKDSGVEKLTK